MPRAGSRHAWKKQGPDRLKAVGISTRIHTIQGPDHDAGVIQYCLQSWLRKGKSKGINCLHRGFRAFGRRRHANCTIDHELSHFASQSQPQSRLSLPHITRDTMSDHIKFEVMIYCAALLAVVASISTNLDLGMLLHTALGIR